MINKKKILITGGAGFIGSNVKNSLKNLNYEILSIGRNKLEDLKIDLKDPSLQNIIKDFLPDVVCHFASGSNIRRASEDVETEFNDTVCATENLLKVLSSLNLEEIKILYLSSQAVYGLPLYLPVDEVHPTKPLTAYGNNKLKVETLITRSKLNYLIFRISTVYGKEQDYNKSGVVASFIEKMKNNEPPIVFNSLDVVTDLIYVNDVTGAIIKAIKDDSLRNEIFNLGSGKAISLKDLLKILYKYFPRAPQAKLQTNTIYPTKKQKGLYLDIRKIQARLNWAAKYNIEEGLKEMLESKGFLQEAGEKV